MQLTLRILTVLAFSIGAAADAAAHEARFSAPEVEIITRYYHALAAPTEPRGRGANRLPRGITKNLARGKALPPGLAKRALPNELVVQLPPPPIGYERLVVAGKILLIETTTQVVHDVLTDILFR
jgi:hypothetical protein